MDVTCVDKRITEILRQLEETNGTYALAAERRKDLRWKLDEISCPGQEITISGSDCDDLCEYFALQAQQDIAVRRALYCQGLRDCVGLLKHIGVL